MTKDNSNRWQWVCDYHKWHGITWPTKKPSAYWGGL